MSIDSFNTGFKYKKYIKQLAKFEKEWTSLIEPQKNIVRIIFWRFKKHFPGDYSLYFSIIYSLYFFKKIPLNDKRLLIVDLNNLDLFYKNFLDEQSNSMAEFVNSFLQLPGELKELKVVIKYTIICWGKKMELFRINKELYARSAGVLIPRLSYKGMSKISIVFQDYYFKQLYFNKYRASKKIYEKQMKIYGDSARILTKATNALGCLLQRLKLFTIIKVREKTLFSFYNKFLRKGSKKDKPLLDLLGIKLLFKTENQIKKFIKEFEKVYMIIERKDYLSKPKESGYKGYHLIFGYTFEKHLIPIEVQLKTFKQEEANNKGSISHFVYSLKKNKWDKSFEEIRQGLDLFNFFANNKKIKLRDV